MKRFPLTRSLAYAAVVLLGLQTATGGTELPIDCRAMSYNIKHAHGMDGKVDLARIARVIAAQKPDFVALQEVDDRAERSGRVNQAAVLGKRLDMHAEFGSFMDFQGGRYGLAVLSRYPIVRVTQVELPKGEEMRIGLAVEVRMPNGDSVMLINIHFDWVGDDTARFSQATKLSRYLRGLKMPYILMGDFNDEPGSRTLKLFQEQAVEAKKPSQDRFTFSSTKPTKEIDFLFTAPKHSWSVREMRVIDEPLASDHRPIVADLRYVGALEPVQDSARPAE